MIFIYFLEFVLLIVSGLFVFLPVVHLSDIPLVGSSIVSVLTIMVQYWNTFLTIVPYFKIVWQMFLFVILPFEILLLIAKFFLGHHTPVHTN